MTTPDPSPLPPALQARLDAYLYIKGETPDAIEDLLTLDEIKFIVSPEGAALLGMPTESSIMADEQIARLHSRSFPIERGGGYYFGPFTLEESRYLISQLPDIQREIGRRLKAEAMQPRAHTDTIDSDGR